MFNTEWQPIQTAPKDGTKILASDDSDIIQVIYWRDSDWRLPWNHDVFEGPMFWVPLPRPFEL